jgi:hypothetical protein
MKTASRTRKTNQRVAASRRPHVKRIDGARHWPRTLDQFIWLLLRAGITPDQLTRVMRASLRKHRNTRALAMPSPEVLEYSRVLTHWQNEPEYLDEYGNARSLNLTGRSASFASLVRQSIPNAQASEVLAVLSRHGLVSNARNGRVRMLATAFLPRREQRAQFLAYTLSSLEGIFDTCYSNLTTKDPKKHLGQMQRTAVSERFDMRRLAEYDAFLRDSAAAFLVKHDSWLKRREIKQTTATNNRIGYVGVGIFGFRAR